MNIKEDKYISNIKNLIENNIIEVRKRNIQNEQDRIYTYWNIGREIIKAQNEDKIKYGNSFVKNLSVELTKLYGSGYDYSNLRRMVKLYTFFPNVGTLTPHFINWSHLCNIIPLKDENERNYYINLVNDNKLSVRQLKKEIKNKAFERLDDNVKENIKLGTDDHTILHLIKDSLVLDMNGIKTDELTEKALKKVILEKIQEFLLELGKGFAFIGSEKKIKIGGVYKYIDLLFFNYIENCFAVVELKIDKLKASDIGQLRLYMNYIDAEIKEGYHKRTIGILICRKNDKTLLKYLDDENIKITTYRKGENKNGNIKC